MVQLKAPQVKLKAPSSHKDSSPTETLIKGAVSIAVLGGVLGAFFGR